MTRLSIAPLALAWIVASCGGDGDETSMTPVDVPDVVQAVDTVADVAPQPDTSGPQCPAGTRWEPGLSSFTEATEAWGLKGVKGIRLSVTDLDSDGWPDLLIRLGGGPDIFTGDGERGRWLLRNTGQGTFEDVTQASGFLTARKSDDPNWGRPGEVVATGDVDNDGDLDIYMAKSGNNITDADGETSELMLSNGDGTFSLGPEDSFARFANEVTVPAGVSLVDFDRDGNLDLWITQNMAGGASWPLPDRLFKGDGTGHFSDMTAPSGISASGWNAAVHVLNGAKGFSWAWSAAACDLNNDGWPELLASSYGRAPNHLWRAELDPAGAVKFVNESVASGYAYDHRTDGSDNQSARCHCQDFPQDEDCAGIPEPELNCEALKAAFGGNYRWNHASDREAWRLGGNSGATICADVDNDGWIDLVTNEIVHWDVGSSSDPSELLVNQGDPAVRFSRPGGEALGLVRKDELQNWDRGDMSGAVFDFDNDGWPDIYVGSSDYFGNKALLFHQSAPLSFQRLEFGDYFEHARAHGVAVADFDRDGDLDVVGGHSLMRCEGDYGKDCYENEQVRFFENTTADDETSNWLQVRLHGAAGTNRAAIGARVQVTAGGLTQTQVVDGGHGHFGTQRDLTLHFGLGAACEAEISVTWPDKDRTQETFQRAGNAFHELTQGQP